MTSSPVLHARVVALSSALLLIAGDGVAQTACSIVGNAAFCTDGTTARRVGNTVYDSGGSSAVEPGAPHAASGTEQGKPSIGIGPGGAWTKVGNRAYGSNGASCALIGSSIHCR